MLLNSIDNFSHNKETAADKLHDMGVIRTDIRSCMQPTKHAALHPTDSNYENHSTWFGVSLIA